MSRWPRSLLATLLACGAISAAQAANGGSSLEPRLSRALGESVHVANPNLDGSRIAVVTPHQLALSTGNGRIIWRMQRRSLSRWLRDDEVTAAVSARGNWFVLTGGTGYRYALLLDGKGRPRGSVKTYGTPRAITFDHSGRRVAVGTASGRIYLITLPTGRASAARSLKPLPERSIRELNPGGILEGLAFSPDDRLLATTSAGGTTTVMVTTGRVLWQQSVQLASLEPSKDWSSFLLCNLPWHGPQYAPVSVVSRSGRELWTSVYYSPRATLSPDGRFVLMRAGKVSRDTISVPFPYPPLEWMVVDRQGTRLPGSGSGKRLTFRAPDGTRLVMGPREWRAETGSGSELWRAPLPTTR